MSRLAALLALVLWSLCAPPAAAHEVRPATLRLVEDASSVRVTWTQPVRDGRRLALAPVLPEGCAPVAPPLTVLSADGAFVTERWTAACALSGGSVRIDGLDRTLTDVHVAVRTADGRTLTALLRPGAASLSLSDAAAPVRAYLRLGLDHVLRGLDHVLFVLGLLLLLGTRRVLPALTVFTLAHAVSITAVALGAVPPAGPATEAVIALSVAFVGAEAARAARGRVGLGARAWPLVVFAVGLVHGLGFAGGLVATGLPTEGFWRAVIAFNLGVEFGQLAFAGLAAAGLALAARWRASAATALAYALCLLVGTAGTYWTIERVPLLG